MCELFAMSAKYPANVTLSLRELALHGGKLGPHKDGWGIAFYQGHDAWVLRDASAASESPLMAFVQDHTMRSQIVLSHIRRATFGATSLSNTHPFQRELGGRVHTFAHNGDLKGIWSRDGFSLGRFLPVGETDSEYAFCVLMERLVPLWLDEVSPMPTERYRVIEAFAAELRELGPANFLYSDGEFLFVHGHMRKQKDGHLRPPGLHILSRECAPPEGFPLLAGVQYRGHGETPRSDGGPPCEEDGVLSAEAQQRVILVASVPLSDEAWRPLEEGELLMLRHGQVVQP